MLYSCKSQKQIFDREVAVNDQKEQTNKNKCPKIQI